MSSVGKKCKIEQCESLVTPKSAKGMCKHHYGSFRRYGDPLKAKVLVVQKVCKVDNCGRKHEGLGYCKNHRRRYRNHGDITSHAVKHGMHKAVENMIWRKMKNRCNNPKNDNYKHYGQRGIRVCERWNDFTNFYQDMGSRPSPKHSLERLDVNGDYQPDNVVWATWEIQARNTRRQLKPTVGVSRFKRSDKWRARIHVFREIHLGTFNTREEAIVARKAAEEKYWGKSKPIHNNIDS